ncbi:MAG TPA: hypothetical protein PLW93_02895 [Candidatus Absconditabacterales bacterium]|nr:hypothetical protein [Candidatus Absconditabacterales bacterium]
MFGTNIKETEVIVSGKLAGKINQVYDKIVNNDIVGPAYLDGRSAGTFGLDKRKAYLNILANEDYSGREFTDLEAIRVGKCDDEGYHLYFYAVSPGGEDAQIIKSFLEPNGDMSCISQPIFDKPFCHCKCQANNFIKVNGPRGRKRILPNGSTKSGTGVQINHLYTSTNEQEGRFADAFGSSANSAWNFGVDVNIGDYIYVYCSGSEVTNAIVGQVRKIIGYDSTTKELILDLPWNLTTNITAIQQEGDEAEYVIFSEWGETLVYATCSGLKSIHPDEGFHEVLPICGAETIGDTCITSLNYHNGQIHYINDKGWNVFSEKGYNQFAFDATNSVPLPPSTLNGVSFRNHIVYFGRDFTGAIYPVTADNSVYASYNVSDSIGIWSEGAYFVDENALLVVNSDKRFKAVSIVQNGSSVPYLQTQDITEYFSGDLDALQYGDKVYINKVGTEIRIHIIGREVSDGIITTGLRTKILILDTEYGVYHQHHICNAEVKKYLGYGLYGGTGVFARCGYMDGGRPDENGTPHGTLFYTQYISVVLGDNNNSAFNFDSFSPKKLLYTKTMLGPSILTDGGSEMNYIQWRNGYKATYTIQDWENIERINNWNKLFAGEEIEVTDCMIDDLLECQNIEDPCKYGVGDEYGDKYCNCPSEKKRLDDYCICYKDKSYFLSRLYPVENKKETKYSDIIKIEWKSTGGDRMYFMGFVSQLRIGQLTDDIYDNNTLSNNDCCAKKCLPTKCI